jgi:perosamine synthetase
LAKLDSFPDLIMRCAEPGSSPAYLLADYLAGGRAPSFPQADGRSIIFTESGRAAILLAARLWGICQDDEVLVPAYNCGSEISPLIATGARVSMYRIDSNAQIDFEDLRRRINQHTRLIHIIHYFGRPAGLDELAALCRKNNIKLLEDCALSLFSGNTGRSGDGAVFSFYKTLPTSAGGALALRDWHSPTVSLRPPKRRQTAREAFSLVKKWAKASFLTTLPRTPRPYRSDKLVDLSLASQPDMPASYYCDPNAQLHRAPRLISGAIQRANVAQIVQARRMNYEFLRRRLLHTQNISLLWQDPLEVETSPLGFPLLVPDKPRWCADLNASGIPVSSWWSGCHRGLDWTEYPEALLLKTQLILLPVHQNLDAGHMEFIARTVCALAATVERPGISHRETNRPPAVTASH